MVKKSAELLPMAQVAAEVQKAAEYAFQKTTATLEEVADLALGNSEAMAESGKVMSDYLKDVGTGYMTDGPAMLKMLNDDALELAAIRSPLQFFNFQANMLSRNFGLVLDYGSKNSEAILKLAQKASAPLSERAAVATASLAKAQ